jgi:hypothetical protein
MSDKQQQWLSIYISPEDANLSKIEFLSVVALRIRDDLDAFMCGGKNVWRKNHGIRAMTDGSHLPEKGTPFF